MAGSCTRPALRPSSTRAAPAKNRIWSSARRHLLGAGQLDRLAGVLALRRDDLLGPGLQGVGEPQQRPLPLARGGVAPASRTRPTRGPVGARRRPRAGHRGPTPNTSPVLGSIRSLRRPSAASTSLPSMKFWTVRATIHAPLMRRTQGVPPRYRWDRPPTTTDFVALPLIDDELHRSRASAHSWPWSCRASSVSAAMSASTMIRASSGVSTFGFQPRTPGRLGGVADQRVDLGRPQVPLVEAHVVCQSSPACSNANSTKSPTV